MNKQYRNLKVDNGIKLGEYFLAQSDNNASENTSTIY